MCGVTPLLVGVFVGQSCFGLLELFNAVIGRGSPGLSVGGHVELVPATVAEGVPLAVAVAEYFGAVRDHGVSCVW